MRLRLASAAALAAIATGLLGGCSSGTGTGSTASASGSPIGVLASTNVWADIATHIGGTDVSVSALINDPNQDPHAYQVSAKTKLALSRAQLVIYNGGGYDDFVPDLLATLPSRPTLNAVDISGKHAETAANEHVWYDFGTVAAVAQRIADALSQLQPSAATTFQAHLAAFTAALTDLGASVTSIARDHSGQRVAITEPVPLYLLQACGLQNATPAAFSHAVEEGTDSSPRVLSEVLKLFTDHLVVALVFNSQTSGPQTDRVITAAKKNHIAAVAMTETLPSGHDYLSWMRENLAALRTAVGG